MVIRWVRIIKAYRKKNCFQDMRFNINGIVIVRSTEGIPSQQGKNTENKKQAEVVRK